MIIEEKLSYQEASERSDFQIKKLRWIVHRKRQIGNINDKPGRARLLDSTSEENIMNKCHTAATEADQISSPEFKKLIKGCIRNEFLETFKRRYSQTTTEKYRQPAGRTVGRYLNEFSQNMLKTFKN